MRYSSTPVTELLPFSKIHEQYLSEDSCYVIGDIRLADLIANREVLSAKDVFVANTSTFFEHLD